MDRALFLLWIKISVSFFNLWVAGILSQQQEATKTLHLPHSRFIFYCLINHPVCNQRESSSAAMVDFWSIGQQGCYFSSKHIHITSLKYYFYLIVRTHFISYIYALQFINLIHFSHDSSKFVLNQLIFLFSLPPSWEPEILSFLHFTGYKHCKCILYKSLYFSDT